MKRNAILHSHGQGQLRIQEAIEEFKNQLDPFFKKKWFCMEPGPRPLSFLCRIVFRDADEFRYQSLN